MQKLYTLLLFLAGSYTSFSQQTTNTTGGSGQAGNIILDWSVGELTLVNTLQGGNLMFTNGVLQGKLVAFTTSGTISNGELNVTPNPTPGLLYIQSGFLEPGQLELRLYDAQGRLLIVRDQAVSSFNTSTMNLASFASDVYMLRAVFTPTSGRGARKRTYKILRLP